MKKYLLILFCTISMGAAAQTYSTVTTDSIEEEVGVIPESLDANVDSLLRSWHVQYFSKKDDYCHDDVENIQFPDSIYQERLKRLPHLIPLPYNRIVRDCIDLYASRRRELVRYMLGMADFYFPMIEQTLDKYHLPLELKYLTVVESAMNPLAVSRVGASGLWQFMLPTGKNYGLEVNSLVDDRRDPEKSTEAACKYLQKLYNVYGDWSLALASYNCGPGNVNKAIRRSGGKTDFWTIFPYLPRETRSYVPLFIAANYIMNYYCEHNICPMQTSLPLATDTVLVDNYLHLRQVSEVLNLDIEELRALNPQYLHDIVPGSYEKRVLRLPASGTYAFADKTDTIYKHRAAELLAAYQPDAPGTLIAQQKQALEEPQRITHVVRRGDTLARIADRYGVTASEVKRWNHLRSNRVSRGKRIYIYVSPEEDNEELADNTPTVTVTTKSIKSSSSKKKNSKGFVTYKVLSGDTIPASVRRYHGVTANALKKVNRLNNSMIKAGQVIKIPVG